MTYSPLRPFSVAIVVLHASRGRLQDTIARSKEAGAAARDDNDCLLWIDLVNAKQAYLHQALGNRVANQSKTCEIGIQFRANTTFFVRHSVYTSGKNIACVHFVRQLFVRCERAEDLLSLDRSCALLPVLNMYQSQVVPTIVMGRMLR